MKEEFQKNHTIFRSGITEPKNSFFKKTQIFKALQKPIDLNLLNFDEVAEKEDFIGVFKKEAVLKEFLLRQTIKNRSLSNAYILIYSLLFFINCVFSTLYPFFTTNFSFDNLSSYFYLGVCVLMANIIFYLCFERYGFKTDKNDWWKIHNFKVMVFSLTMTIAQIKFMIDLDSNPLFRNYEFLYFWGHLQYPLILFMLTTLMQGILLKMMMTFITQSLLISFMMISEKHIKSFEIIFVIILSFFYIFFFFIFIYVEEIHLKEKYEFYLNFKKNAHDWQHIIDNVPYGLALFKKEPSHDLIFSNSYGNDVLKINISSPQENCLEKLSRTFGRLKKVAVSDSGHFQNSFEIASQQKIEHSMKSMRKYENSMPDQGFLKDIFSILNEKSHKINIEKTTIVYKTNEKLKLSLDNPTSLMGFEEKHFLINIKPILFENKQIFLLIIEDNSQYELINSLKENNDYKSKLLSSFSHELRTPLNGALPLLKNLYSDENLKKYDAEKHYQLCIAIQSLSILQMVLNDIVDYAQINSNQLQLNCTETDIRQAIMECIEIVSLQIKEKTIDLKIIIDQKIPAKFFTDRNRFMQILLNILRNSIKFSKNGGKILFSTSNFDISRNNLITFRIEDSGVGMSPSDLLNLRDILKNIKEEDVSHTTLQSGNLGLVISQNLAIILGPSNDLRGINIESKINRGTTVEFLIEDKMGLQMAGGEFSSISTMKIKTLVDLHGGSLGIKRRITKRAFTKKQSLLWLEKGNITEESCEANANERDSVDFVNPSELYPKKLDFSPINKKIAKIHCCESILVVDDDPFNLLSAEVIIKKCGYSLVKAFDGKQAVEIVQERYNLAKCNDTCKKFLMILMDYNMPVMNGIESTRILKEKMERGEIPEIPIIACSAFCAKDDLINCFEAGMNDYVSKPINIEALKKIFSKWIKNEEEF